MGLATLAGTGIWSGRNCEPVGRRGESSVVWDTPWPLAAWPDVATRFILCEDDHFFPAAFMRRVAQERLGIAPDEVPGCHCVALSHPKALTDLLVSYL